MQRATPADYDRICAFYQYVIATTPTMRTCCRWEYGKHPTDALILHYVTAGDMYYCEKDGKIVGVIAVTKAQEGDYCTAPWQEKFADDAVAVGHILCVDPQCARQGIASALLQEACEMSRSWGKKAFRFDTLLTNKPAQALYDGLGFTRVSVERWNSGSVGETEFVLYERLL